MRFEQDRPALDVPDVREPTLWRSTRRDQQTQTAGIDPILETDAPAAAGEPLQDRMSSGRARLHVEYAAADDVLGLATLEGEEAAVRRPRHGRHGPIGEGGRHERRLLGARPDDDR